MRITNIEIQNYGPIEHANIPITGNALALFGNNGNAKSMVISAVQYALFGYNEYTDKRGSGIKDLIRDGASASDIHVTFETDKYPTPLTLHASITSKKAEWFCCDDASGELIDNVESRDDFWHFAGINKDHAALCAFPVQTVTGTAISDALTGLLGDCITPESVGAAAGEHKDWLGKLLKKRHIKISGAESLETIGKFCYEDRAGLNKEIKAQQAEWETAPYRYATQPVKDDGSAFSVEDIPNIESQLARLRNERDEIIKAIGACGAGVEDVDAHDEALATLAKAVTAADKGCKGAEKELEKAQSISTKAEARVEEARKIQAGSSTLARENNERLVQLARTKSSMNLDGVCITCNRAFDDESRKTVMSALQKEMDALQVIVNGLLATDKLNMDALVAARASGSTAQAALDGARGALDRANRKHTEAIQALSIEKAKSPADPDALARHEEAKAALEARIVKGGRFLTDLKLWADRQSMERSMADNQARLAPLEWAVTAFYHGTITNTLIAAELTKFAGVVNSTLSGFGYKIEYTVEKKNIIPMLLTPGSKHSRPINLCSRGQRLMAAYAVAVSFAKSGAPVLLDDINDLDSLNRRTLLLSLAESGAESVIVAGAWQQNQALPDMESAMNFVEALGDVTVAWVQDGNITVINEGVEV